MNKTISEIFNGKKYHELTQDELVAFNARVDYLAVQSAKSTDAFEELYNGLTPFINALSYRYAERSYSTERDDFVGIINLVFVESLRDYDPAKGVPFQPFFAMNVRNEIKMMYRDKSKDLHDTTFADLDLRIDVDTRKGNDGDNQYDDSLVIANVTDEAFHRILADQLIQECYGDDDVKRTVILMYLDGFKLVEIANAINTDNKKFRTVEKFVQRTVKQFKGHANGLN